MTPELFHLVTQILRQERVGTLSLGSGAQGRQVFFEGSELHLLHAGVECRFVPAPQLGGHPQLPPATLRELLVEIKKVPQSVGKLIDKRGLFEKEELRDLYTREETEEILMLFDKHLDRFKFEEGLVPEELLLGEGRSREPIESESFLEQLETRAREQHSIHRVLPSVKELLVVSERGLAAKSDPEQWLFATVADLIDGFRSLQELIDDSIFFPHQTLQILHAALRQGFAKKCLFPELVAVDPQAVTPQQANEMVPVFEEALSMASDDLPIRVRLAGLYLRGGMLDQALQEFDALGDLHLRRGDYRNACVAYRDALHWNPDSSRLLEKFGNVIHRGVEEALHRNDVKGARQLLREGLFKQPDQLDLYLKFLDTFDPNDPEFLSTIDELIYKMKEWGQEQLGPRLFMQLLERNPISEPVRRQYVNFCLDHGDVRTAVAEMELMAGYMVEEGRTREAEAVYEKARRFSGTTPRGNSKKAKKKRAKAEQRAQKGASKRGRASWMPSPLFAIVTLIVMGFGGYQAYGYLMLEELQKKAHALTIAPTPELGSPQHHDHHKQSEGLLRELRSYSRRHFLTIWSFSCRKTAKDLENRLALLDGQLQAELSRLFTAAERAETVGRLGEARQYLSEIADRGKNTVWAQKVAHKLESLQGYSREAEELHRKARQLLEDENYTAAFDHYRQLLTYYSRSEVARNVRLPIYLTTAPGAAEVRAGDTELGTTPLLIEVNPFEPLHLELFKSGFRREQILVEDPSGPNLHVVLQRR